jgi:hypothetical protein
MDAVIAMAIRTPIAGRKNEERVSREIATGSTRLAPPDNVEVRETRRQVAAVV